MKLIVFAVMINVAAAAVAGSLTPPGPPGPTMKTLDDIEARIPIHKGHIPFTISQPGSYYLAESIHVEPDASITTAAIIIASGYVTIDLNGFTLRGSNEPGISGIYADGHMENITIRDGSISHWEETAVRLSIDAAIIQNVTIAENLGSGIHLSGGRILNCVVRNNGLEGIAFRASVTNGVAAGSCLIHQCEVFNNGETGIYSDRQITISDTVSQRNSGSGILLDAQGSTIKNCTVSQNNDTGILVTSDGFGSVITGNTCSRNNESGIVIDAFGCRIEENHCADNDIDGYTVRNRSMVLKNTAFNNAGQNYALISEAVAGPIVFTTTSGIITSEHPWANLSFHRFTIGN